MTEFSLAVGLAAAGIPLAFVLGGLFVWFILLNYHSKPSEALEEVKVEAQTVNGNEVQKPTPTQVDYQVDTQVDLNDVERKMSSDTTSTSEPLVWNKKFNVNRSHSLFDDHISLSRSSTPPLNRKRSMIRETVSGYQVGSTADYISETLRKVAEHVPLPPATKAELLIISKEVIAKNTLQTPFLEWQTGTDAKRQPVDVDKDIRDWLKKDYELGLPGNEGMSPTPQTPVEKKRVVRLPGSLDRFTSMPTTRGEKGSTFFRSSRDERSSSVPNNHMLMQLREAAEEEEMDESRISTNSGFCNALTQDVQDVVLEENETEYEKLCKDPKIQGALEGIGEWEYNIFELESLCPENTLALVAMAVFVENQVPLLFDFTHEELWMFLKDIQAGMHPVSEVPFHNATHVADVLQTMHVFINTGGLAHWISDLERFALLLACVVHDYDHPGVNNAFMVNSRHELAVRYNDMSVLENHHIAAAFKLITDHHPALFRALSSEKYAQFRHIMISLIQSTDMKTHFAFMSEAQAKLAHAAEVAKAKYAEMEERSNEDEDAEPSAHPYSVLGSEDRLILFRMALKCADISNPAKPQVVAQEWTRRVMEEFFRQGDKEKELGLPVSPMCDRVTTVVSKTQFGFIDFVVLPLFGTWVEHVPWVEIQALPNLQAAKLLFQEEMTKGSE